MRTMVINDINELKNSINSMLGLKNSISNINGLKNSIDNMNGLKNSISNINGLKNSIDSMNGLKNSISNINGLKNINSLKGTLKSIDSYSENLLSLQDFITEFKEKNVVINVNGPTHIVFSEVEFVPHKGQAGYLYANSSEVKTTSTDYYEKLIVKLTTKFLNDRDAKTCLELKWAVSQLNSILHNSKSRLKHLIYLIKCELISNVSIYSNKKFDKFIQRYYCNSNLDEEDANIYSFTPNFGLNANLKNRNCKYSHLIHHEKNYKRNYYRRSA